MPAHMYSRADRPVFFSRIVSSATLFAPGSPDCSSYIAGQTHRYKLNYHGLGIGPSGASLFVFLPYYCVPTTQLHQSRTALSLPALPTLVPSGLQSTAYTSSW